MSVSLDTDDLLTVISAESLALDRIRQATDRTDVTFNRTKRSLDGIHTRPKAPSVRWRRFTDDRSEYTG